MITLAELSERIGKPVSSIRYYITHDKEFVKTFWVKQKTILYNSRGFNYHRNCYFCNEKDIDKIIKYLETRKPHERINSHWSNIAVHCWERKMTCKGCCFHKYCGEFEHPPMKEKVLENVRLYGEPK